MKLRIINLKKTYPDEDEFSLDIPELVFPETGMVLISGHSGCGKSTLLNIIAGLEKEDSGEVLFDSEDRRNKKEFYAEDLSIVQTDVNVINSFSVVANLQLCSNDQSKIDEVIKQMNLPKKRKVSKLSKGESERVALACALLKDTPILLVDEPTANLDSENSQIVYSVLKKQAEHSLVIICSHDVEGALSYCDRHLEMEDGRIIQDETLNEYPSNGQLSKGSSLKNKNQDLLKLGVKKAYSNKVAAVISCLLFCMGFFFAYCGFNVDSFSARRTLINQVNEQDYHVAKDLNTQEYIESTVNDSGIENPINYSKDAYCNVTNFSTFSARLLFIEDYQERFPSIQLNPEFRYDSDDEIFHFDCAISQSVVDAARRDFGQLETHSTFRIDEFTNAIFSIHRIFEDDVQFFDKPIIFISKNAYQDYLQDFGASFMYESNMIEEFEAEVHASEVVSYSLAINVGSHLVGCDSLQGFRKSEQEAIDYHEQTGGLGYYLAGGRLPENPDEILISGQGYYDYFYGDKKAVGEKFLSEKGLEYLSISNLIIGGHSTVELQIPDTYKIVGCFLVVGNYGTTWSNFALGEPVFCDSLHNLERKMMIDFENNFYSSEYAVYRIDDFDKSLHLNDIYINHDGMQQASRFMKIVAVCFMAIGLILAFIYLVTVFKSLKGEEKLLTLWGYSLKGRMKIYLTASLSLVLPAFILSCILAPAVFPVLAEKMMQMTGIVYTNWSGFLALFIATLASSAITCLPSLIGKKR